LHDNMGAYTSALMANMQQLKTKTGEHPDLDKMQNNAEQIMSSLRETIWVLNSKEVTVVEMNDSFKNYCFKIVSNFPEIDFDAQEEIESNKVIPAGVAIHLNKMMQEIMQNIIKHANASQITYHIHSNEKLVIELTDNGKGFDTNASSSGNGLENLNWRAKEAGCKLNIESSVGKGTKIIMEL
jgi:signal transduction histidine kinase